MQNALYVEISAIGILLLLIILITQRQMIGSSALQMQFNRLIYATMIMLVVDSGCWLIDGTTFPHARALNYAIETVYYVFHLLLPFLWALYVEVALSTDLKAARRRLIISTIPLILLIAFLPFNIKLGYVFTIDAANHYHRGSGFLTYAFVTYAYLIYASVRALIKAKESAWNEDRKRCYNLAVFSVLPATGGVLQYFFFGLSVNWILTALAILLVYIDAQNRQISADPLTGLNNRRELSKFLLRETRENQGEGVLALLMMDVDGFKLVNDTYGHFYGDNVLMAVAKVLKQSCKNTAAFLGRYGGDEFCVVYPAVSKEAVTALIQSIREGLSAWNAANPEMCPIGVSIGYAIWDTQENDSAEAMIKRADQHMYEEKNAKRHA